MEQEAQFNQKSKGQLIEEIKKLKNELILLKDELQRQKVSNKEACLQLNTDHSPITTNIPEINSQQASELSINLDENNAKRIQRIFDSFQDAYFQADNHGNLTFINQTAVSMFGFAIDEIVGSPASMLYANPNERDLILHSLHKAGRIEDYTIKGIKKDGTTFWVSMNVQFVYDNDANIIGTEGVVRDISERMEVQKQLREVNEKFENITATSPDAFVLARFPDGVIIYANEQLAKMLRIPLNQLIDPKTPGFYNYLDDREKMVSKLMAGETIENWEVNIKRADGSSFWAMINARLGVFMGDQTVYAGVRDISAPKQLEASRSDLLNRFNLLDKHIPGVIYLYRLRKDGSSHFPYASSGIKKIYGFLPEVVKEDASECLKVIHPDDLARVTQSINESARELTMWHEVYRVNLPAGELIWVEGNAIPTKQDDGSTLWHGYIQDITSRKKIEEDISIFKIISDNAVYGKAIATLDGKLTYVNRFFANIHGYEPQDVIGNHISMFHSREQLPEVEKRIAEMLQLGAFSSSVLWHVHKDGTEFPMLMSGVTVKDDYGKPLFIAVTAVDMTAYHKAQKKYEGLFNEMLDGFALHEIILNESGLPVDYRFLAVNPSFERITGLKGETLIGKRVLEVLPETEQHWIDTYGRVALEREPVAFESYSKEFEKFFKVTSFSPAQGQFASIFEDITERKLAEIALTESNQRLESFLEIGNSISSAIDKQKIVQLIVENTTRLLNQESAAIYLIHDNETIHLEATIPPISSDFPEFVRIALIRDHPHIERAILTQKPVIMADASTAELSPAEEEIIAMRNLQSNLYLPIKVREKVIGVLILSSNKVPATFSNHEIQLVQGFANQAANLLDNARSFERIREYADELEQEIIRRKHAEESIKRNRQHLLRLLELHRIADGPDSEVFNYTFEATLEVAQSNFAFLGILNTDGTVSSLNAWSEGAIANAVLPEKTVHLLFKNHKLLENILSSKKAVVVNDCQISSSNKKEHVQGLVAVHRLLCVPVIVADKIVALGIVANKESDYTEYDITALTSLLHEMWNIIELKIHQDELFKLSQALEQSPASVVITNLKGEIEYVNSKYTKFTGFYLDDVIGLLPSILEKDEQTSAFYDDLWVAIKSGKEWRGEFMNSKKNGDYFWEDVSISHLINSDGEDSHYIVLAEDITTRKKLEENLLLHANLQDLLTEISTGFINLPMESVDDAIHRSLKKMALFVSADRAYTFDYDWENQVCHNIHEWCQEGIEPQIEVLQNVPLSMMAWWVDSHHKGEILSIMDVLSLDPSDGVRQLLEPQNVKSLLAVPMMNDNECIGFVGFDSVLYHHTYNIKEIQLLKIFAQLLVNVNLRRAMIFELVMAKEKAEESDRLKSAFLANMSHEIRTPMNGILGFADLLKEPQLSADKQQLYIEVIRKSGMRMLNIINDIVDISKIEAGLMKVALAETDVNEQLHFIYTFFEPEARAKGLSIHYHEYLQNDDSFIQTDREKVYAVLTNLVKNAIKYTKKGRIDFGCIRKNDYLEFFVKDSGIGIQKDRQEIIFERFIQADIVDKMAYQGAGLGLAISKAYVEMLGGRIWLESESGVGTSFYFTLPCLKSLDKEPLKTDVLACSVTTNIAKLKVLIAEDDETSLLLIKTIIEPIAKEILVAAKGDDAINLFSKNPDIDLVFMDIRLPELNGYEAIKQIREKNKHVVIIAQTAYGLTGDRKKAIEAGSTDYIAKPINRKELLALVEKYF